MQNYLNTQPAPTALPLQYDISPIPASPDWIYELRWQGAPLDTFYSIGDAVDAGLEHAAFVEGGFFDDCVSGDMHVLTPACPGERFHSYVEAAGAAFALEERAALVPDYCDRCDGFHLVLERAVSAEGFGVD